MSGIMRGLAYCFGLWMVVGFASACGDTSADPKVPAGDPDPVGACFSYACTCENGLNGSFDCDRNECSCDACPSFAPAEPAPFEACGGDPTGFWRLSDYDQGRFELS